jgi:hypothetical protein
MKTDQIADELPHFQLQKAADSYSSVQAEFEDTLLPPPPSEKNWPCLESTYPNRSYRFWTKNITYMCHCMDKNFSS